MQQRRSLDRLISDPQALVPTFGAAVNVANSPTTASPSTTHLSSHNLHRPPSSQEHKCPGSFGQMANCFRLKKPPHMVETSWRNQNMYNRRNELAQTLQNADRTHWDGARGQVPPRVPVSKRCQGREHRSLCSPDSACGPAGQPNAKP